MADSTLGRSTQALKTDRIRIRQITCRVHETRVRLALHLAGAGVYAQEMLASRIIRALDTLLKLWTGLRGSGSACRVERPNREITDSRTTDIFKRDTAYFHCDLLNYESKFLSNYETMSYPV